MAAALAKVVKNAISPVYTFRVRYKEKTMKKKLTDWQIVHAFADLLEEIPPPETPEEADAELRAAGLDPERIGRETVALARLSRCGV